MSNCKTQILSEHDLNRYADIFKALANPNRLRILLELAGCPEGSNDFSTTPEQMENCQQEFAKILGLAPSTVSHHFKELRNAGLVEVSRQGKSILVRVDRRVLASVKELF